MSKNLYFNYYHSLLEVAKKKVLELNKILSDFVSKEKKKNEVSEKLKKLEENKKKLEENINMDIDDVNDLITSGNNIKKNDILLNQDNILKITNTQIYSLKKK
jgi:predicted nuclease with TOPRIM domain